MVKKGSGWHKETKRHSEASVKGWNSRFGKKKTSLSQVRKLQAKRSNRAKTIDGMKNARIVGKNRYAQWVGNPARFDVEGVDTKKSGKKVDVKKLTAKEMEILHNEEYEVTQKRLKKELSKELDYIYSKSNAKFQIKMFRIMKYNTAMIKKIGFNEFKKDGEKIYKEIMEEERKIQKIKDKEKVIELKKIKQQEKMQEAKRLKPTGKPEKFKGEHKMRDGAIIKALDVQKNYRGIGVRSVRDFLKNEVVNVEVVETDSMDKWNRTKYNRMTDSDEQHEYTARLKKPRTDYEAFVKGGSFFNLSKLEYEGYKRLR